MTVSDILAVRGNRNADQLGDAIRIFGLNRGDIFYLMSLPIEPENGFRRPATTYTDWLSGAQTSPS